MKCEAGIFAYDKGPSHLHLPSSAWPSKAALREMQRWLRDLWPRLREQKVVALQASAPTVVAYIDSRFIKQIQPNQAPWQKAFPTRVADVLTDPEVSIRFRFCLQCQKPFCANKRQMYCSGSCSLTHRTNKWRQRNPEKFRAARRKAYERKVKAELGGSVRAGTRSRRSIG